MSGTVTSRAKHLPLDHGTRVAPSGLFLSSCNSLVGSLIAYAPALSTALQMMSLSSRCWHLALLQQAKQWSPLALTFLPSTQMYGPQVFVPSRYHTVTLIALSSSLRPTAVIRGASNQSPTWAALAASKRALSNGVVTLSRSSACHDAIPGFLDVGGWARWLVCPRLTEPHLLICVDCFIPLITVSRRKDGIWKMWVPAADAIKTGGASVSAVRNPNPPNLIGKIAWVYWSLFKSTLYYAHEPFPQQ